MKLVHVSGSVQCIVHIHTTPKHRCFQGSPKFKVLYYTWPLSKCHGRSWDICMWTFCHSWSEAEYCNNCRGSCVPWSRPFGIHLPFSHTLQCLASYAYMDTGSNNQLQIRLVFFAAKFVLPVLRECQVLVHFDNIVKVKYIKSGDFVWGKFTIMLQCMHWLNTTKTRNSVSERLWKVWQGIH